MSKHEIVKIPGVKRLLLAVAMAALVTGSAQAAESYLSPRNDVALTGDTLTVGDVFPGIDHDAGYVLGPAPAYGQTMTLSARDLQRVSDAFNLGWNSVTGLEQTIIHRNAHDVDRYAIQAAVEKSLESSVHGQKFDVDLSDRNLSFQLPENVPATAEAQDLHYDLSSGDFRAVIVAPAGSAHPLVKQEVTGRLFPLVSLPVVKAAMRQGDVISADDIDYIDVRSANVATSTVVDSAKLIGMSPRKGIAPLKPIAMSDIAMPLEVKKGDTVLMELKSDAMVLTVQGKALDSGAAGETVRIQNPSSNHVVQAVVTGPKTVSVSAPAAVDGI
jgi:flagella basal body P-ring formation protein FlgA